MRWWWVMAEQTMKRSRQNQMEKKRKSRKRGGCSRKFSSRNTYNKALTMSLILMLLLLKIQNSLLVTKPVRTYIL